MSPMNETPRNEDEEVTIEIPDEEAVLAEAAA